MLCFCSTSALMTQFNGALTNEFEVWCAQTIRYFPIYSIQDQQYLFNDHQIVQGRHHSRYHDAISTYFPVLEK